MIILQKTFHCIPGPACPALSPSLHNSNPRVKLTDSWNFQHEMKSDACLQNSGDITLQQFSTFRSEATRYTQLSTSLRLLLIKLY